MIDDDYRGSGKVKTIISSFPHPSWDYDNVMHTQLRGAVQ